MTTVLSLVNVFENPQTLFGSEDQVLANRMQLRQYCRDILVQRGLSTALAAYDYYIELNKDETRKDGTPAEAHVQLHIVLLDSLLKSEKNRLGYDEEIFGSEDALFAALALHDMIEDNDQTPERLIAELLKGIDIESDQQRVRDSAKAVQMICLMSRNWPFENPPNRSQYNARWASHPGTLLIKMIDWANKLATMPGVELFEKDGQKRMRRNIDETDHLFVDEAQGLTKRAISRHPEIKSKIKKIDAVMAILFNAIKGYTLYSSGSYEGKACDEKPFNFGGLISPAKGALGNLPNGLNLVKILAARIKKSGQDHSKVEEYNKHILEPALALLDDDSHKISKLNRFLHDRSNLQHGMPFRTRPN